jgi:predicted flap endonuclease-1-like 5' DNA nuclease
MGSIDQNILIAVGAAIAIIVLLTIIFGALTRRRQSLRRDTPPPEVEARRDPFPATRERPYMKAATPPPAAVPEPREAPPAPPAPSVTSGVPLDDDDSDVAPPPVPLAGDFAGIAFPPHSTDHPDELTKLKGVGPKLETLLNEQGITRYEQLASLDGFELAALEGRLGNFKGRLTRDRVVEQARLLASGDTEAFEETFGKLGG